MKPAADELATALADLEISRPQTPVVSNVTADYLCHPDQIRDLLIRQLTHPVLWNQSMQKLIADGVPSLLARRMVGINPKTGKRWRNSRTFSRVVSHVPQSSMRDADGVCVT